MPRLPPFVAVLALILNVAACETYTDWDDYEDDDEMSDLQIYCYADIPEDFLVEAYAYLTPVFRAAPPTGGIAIAFRADLKNLGIEVDYAACPSFSSNDTANMNRSERINHYRQEDYQVISLDWRY